MCDSWGLPQSIIATGGHMIEIQRLSFEDVSFSYNDGEQNIFENISFDFPMGENILIGGRAGSGKSTLIRLMAALEEPASGRYFFNDLDVCESSFEEFLPYRLKMGFCPDHGGLLSNRSMADNLLLPVQYHQSRQMNLLDWVEELLDSFEVSDFRNIRPASVTGAVRKVVCVARAFVLKPEVVFLDNPTDGLDSHRVEVLLDLIKRGRKKGWLKHVFITGDDLPFIKELKCKEVSIANGQLHQIEEREAIAV